MEFFERFLSFMNIHFHVIVHVNVQRTFTVHSFHSRIFIYLIEINLKLINKLFKIKQKINLFRVIIKMRLSIKNRIRIATIYINKNLHFKHKRFQVFKHLLLLKKIL